MGKHTAREAAGAARRLDRQTVLLFAVNVFFMAATALSAAFFGVYLWKETHNFVLLGWFTLLVQFAMAITFWIAGNGVKEGNKMVAIRLGIGISAVFYALVLLLGRQAVHYIVLLGVVQGVANGLFWLAYNVLYFEVTNADNRDRYNGLAGVYGSLIGMLVPWASGVLINRLGADNGYRAIFGLSLAIFIIGMIVSFWIRNRRTEGHYNWRHAWLTLRHSSSHWRLISVSLAAQGFRESVFGLLIGLLVYIQTGSELRLGNYLFIVSGVGFVGFYAVGKWLRPLWRSKGMLFGAIAITLVILPFFVRVNYTTLLLFGIGTSLFFPLYAIPMTSAVFDAIGADKDSAELRVEYVVMRELALIAGRMAGMVVFIVTLSISKEPLAINTMMLLIGSAPIIGWLCMRRLMTPQLRN